MSAYHHPGVAAAGAVATLVGAAVFVGWPLAVIHGWARWPVFGVWCAVLAGVLILFAAARRARRYPKPERPTR